MMGKIEVLSLDVSLKVETKALEASVDFKVKDTDLSVFVASYKFYP